MIAMIDETLLKMSKGGVSLAEQVISAEEDHSSGAEARAEFRRQDHLPLRVCAGAASPLGLPLALGLHGPGLPSTKRAVSARGALLNGAEKWVTNLRSRTIISYIDEQFERYLHDESGLNRRHIIDNRVHCCFYFISPFGHGCAGLAREARPLGRGVLFTARLSLPPGTILKPLDVAFMKAIHNKVNIVPVIAKADTLTLKERERLKKRVRAGLPGGGPGPGGGHRAGLPGAGAAGTSTRLLSHGRVNLERKSMCAVLFKESTFHSDELVAVCLSGTWVWASPPPGTALDHCVFRVAVF
ncbi:SEPT2 [Cervus elaphus hippelaphus]|uniref:SEPT2 n=1 Tax=Cervus elaphus hippelaphus TaxID=46360 RepID=A0A212CGK2_CEREH|nr:SEPT2 [Cervus elaphus hippelaphus]